MTGVRPGPATIAAFSPSKGRGSERVEVSAGRSVRGVRIRLAAAQAEGEPLGTGGVAVTLGERGASPTLEVVIVSVAEASEAERSGLQQGDVITAVDGVAPNSMADARNRLSGANGRDVLLAITRNGSELKLRVTREAVRR
jgi:S1-C subfamily serine protease